MFNPSAPEFVPANSSFHFDAQAPEFVPRAPPPQPFPPRAPGQPLPPPQFVSNGGGFIPTSIMGLNVAPPPVLMPRPPPLAEPPGAGAGGGGGGPAPEKGQPMPPQQEHHDDHAHPVPIHEDQQQQQQQQEKKEEEEQEEEQEHTQDVQETQTAPPVIPPPLPAKTSWAARARAAKDLPVAAEKPLKQQPPTMPPPKKPTPPAPATTQPPLPNQQPQQQQQSGRPGTQPPRKSGRRVETADKPPAGAGGGHGRGRNRRGKQGRMFRENVPETPVAAVAPAPTPTEDQQPRPLTATVTRPKAFIDAVKPIRMKAPPPKKQDAGPSGSTKASEEAVAGDDKALRQAEEEKRKQEEAAAEARQKAAEEEAMKLKAEEEEAAARKKAEEEAAALKKAEEEAAAQKLADEAAAAAARQKAAEEEEAARKKQAEEEEAAAKKQAEEEAAQKQAEEEAAAAAAKQAEAEAEEKAAAAAEAEEVEARAKLEAAAPSVDVEKSTVEEPKAESAEKSSGSKLPGLPGAWRTGRLIGSGDDRVGGMLDRVKYDKLANLDNPQQPPPPPSERLTFAQAAAAPRPAQFERVAGSKNIRYRLEDMMKLREDPSCQGLPDRHNLPNWVLIPTRAAGGAGTPSVQSMMEMGRNAKGDLGKFNRPVGLIMKKGIATSDLAASESSWSTGGARPRNLGGVSGSNASGFTAARSTQQSGGGGSSGGGGGGGWQRQGKAGANYQQPNQPFGASPTVPQFVTGHALPEIPENSWQKEQEKLRAGGGSQEERGIKVMRRWRAQLNKMTPASHHAIFEAIMDIGILDVNEAGEFVKLIFDKAITNHGYIEMYADLCFELKTELERRGIFSTTKQQQQGGGDGGEQGTSSGTDFRRMLLSQCQTAFETHMAQDFKAPDGVEEEEAFELLLEYKKKMKGNLMFVGCLARSQLVPSRVLITILQQTLEIRRPLQLEALASFLPTCVSGLRDAKWLKSFDQLIEKVRDTAHDPAIEQRVRYLLMDALDGIDNMQRPPAAQAVEHRRAAAAGAAGNAAGGNPFEFLKSL